MNLFETAGIKLPALNLVDHMRTPLTATAKLSNHKGWNWYVVAGDAIGDDDVYCYGYVESPIASEYGFFTLKQITDAGACLCLTWKPAIIIP